MNDAGVNLPALPEQARLRVVLASAAGVDRARVPTGAPPFRAEPFGLDRVAQFRGADAAVQRRVAERIARATLEEIWYIEKLGVTFTARMALLGRTTEERVLYAIFAADEARHLVSFSPWVPNPGPPNSFVLRLARLIEEADRVTLACVIQVVMEGWGLSWYRRLRDACIDPGLAAVFEEVLADEAHHFAAGVVVCTGGAEPAVGAVLFPGPAVDAIVEVLVDIFAMVSAGPVTVLDALEAELGPWSEITRAAVCAELDGAGHVRERLDEMRALLSRVPSGLLLERLEAAGALPSAVGGDL